MKFGGSSVANREQIEKVMAIVRVRADLAPVVVSSAHKGITDALIGAARAAVDATPSRQDPIARQREIATSLQCPPDLLDPLLEEIEDLLRGISLVKELSPRSLDYIASFGERMSVRCIADFFSRNGLPARAYDAWDLGFITDDNFGRARPLPDYAANMRAAFSREVPAGIVPIVTGFVGHTASGEITTVGRNGSDLTASLVGAAIGAKEVQIWSDTDGVMTADPSVVTAARNIPVMRFDEAAELAYFGSRVLHPSTLLPAIEGSIPVRVMNTNRPEHPGTVIDRARPDAPGAATNPVTSIAYKENQAVLTLSSTRMFEQVGFLAEVFNIIAAHGVVVDMVATSEISVSLTSHDADDLRRAADDLIHLGTCAVSQGKTILCVVGHGIHASKGLGARILDAMAQASVNVEMLSFGMASINFSMLIDDADIDRAVVVLHRVVFE